MTARRTTRRVVTTAAAAASLVAAGAIPATAAGSSPKVTTLSTAVIAPFQLDVSGGTLYVGDGGTDTASKLTSSGLKTVAKGPQHGEVTGVARSAAGDFAYTSSVFGSNSEEAVAASLTVVRADGSKMVVDLKAFEAAHNPNGRIGYGIDHPTACQAKAFSGGSMGPVNYKGDVNSHPYAVASLGKGSWAVADAGGNDLLRVDPRGTVSLIKVLPRQPFTITAGFVKANKLPKCLTGAVYNDEPVPTDVEVGPDGSLYSTTLPGGVGAAGSVYRVDPATGATTRLATGFAGATNLAVMPNGSIYVAEFYTGQIAKVQGGKATTYLSLPGVLSLTAGNGHLYAGVSAPTDQNGQPTGHGSLVQIDG